MVSNNPHTALSESVYFYCTDNPSSIVPTTIRLASVSLVALTKNDYLMSCTLEFI